MDIKEKVSLKEFTTFRIGGLADFFVHVQSIEELKDVLTYAQKEELNIFILGGGSNIVFSDEGFVGLVIKVEIKRISYRGLKDDEVILEAGGGEVLDELVSFSIVHGFYGIENLSAIPGTVGAALVQNVGAYGVEIGDLVLSVDTINIKTGKEKRFTKKECMFAYRNSFFKTIIGKKYIITKVNFKLRKDGVLNLSYADISNYFDNGQNQSLEAVRNAVISIRSRKFPDINKVGTAGSFFKNPILTNREYKVLQEKFPDIHSYYNDGRHVKIPLGFILEKLGWKGKKYKQVGTYKNQALVIINNKNATQKQLDTFARMIEEDVKEKTGIDIEREVIFIM